MRGGVLILAGENMNKAPDGQSPCIIAFFGVFWSLWHRIHIALDHQ